MSAVHKCYLWRWRRKHQLEQQLTSFFSHLHIQQLTITITQCRPTSDTWHVNGARRWCCYFYDTDWQSQSPSAEVTIALNVQPTLHTISTYKHKRCVRWAALPSTFAFAGQHCTLTHALPAFHHIHLHICKTGGIGRSQIRIVQRTRASFVNSTWHFPPTAIMHRNSQPWL